MMVKTSGTAEWADSNVNCYYGCSNNCRYCYARFMAFRFKRIEKDEDWETMIPNEKAINKGYRKRKGRVMFPTSHDITIESFSNCIKVLGKLLTSGNQVLITTKPSYLIIIKLCEIFKDYKKSIQFRFTITSKEDETLAFFEPNAPFFEERLYSLEYAFELGFKTSVSIEPYLDSSLNPLIEEIAPYCSESIWIGSMSNLQKVVARGIWDIQQVPHDPTKYNKEVADIRKYIRYIHEINQLPHIELIIEDLKKLPEDIRIKLRLKDSIRNLGFSL